MPSSLQKGKMLVNAKLTKHVFEKLTSTSGIRRQYLHTVDEPLFLQNNIDKYYNRKLLERDDKDMFSGVLASKTDICLQSNDYLAIGKHPKIIEAKIQGLRENKDEVFTSAVIFGANEDTENIRHKYEQEMAKHLGTEAVLLCQSGYMANVGLLQAIANTFTKYPFMIQSNPNTKKIPVYIDKMAHWSLWEGIKSAGAMPCPFNHNNIHNLETLVWKHGPGVIVVDSVYSTDGSLGKLEDVVNIGAHYDCAVVVDESHSLGLFGPSGGTMVSELGLTDKVHFITSSLSKALVGRGGIIGCNKRTKEFLIHTSSPAIFSSAVLSSDVSGFMATLEVIQTENSRRIRLRENASYLRTNLIQLGYKLAGGNNSDTTDGKWIISLEAGTEENLVQLRKKLESQGIFGASFFPPATPQNQCIMRFTVNSDLTKKDLDIVLEVCDQIKRNEKLSPASVQDAL